MGSFSWIEYLKDPQLVANFQQYFGVQVQPPSCSSAATNCKCDSSDSRILDKSQDLYQRKPQDSSTLSEASIIKPLDVGSPNGSISWSPHQRSENYNGLLASPNLLPCKICNAGDEHFDADETIEKKSAPKAIIKNKFWYFLFSFGTALGDEAFYAFSFCFWFWNVDGSVGRRVVYVWALLMYIGQGLKDIIKWPRPQCPPVVRLARKWELEYGMPSTHAIVGSAVPFASIFFTSTRYQYPVTVGLLIAVLWCSLVCTSRIYLGMHTVLDVLAGLGIVALGIGWVMALVDWLDPILLTSEYGALCLCAGAIILTICSPGGDRWTPARGDTVVILGTCVGINTGAWLNYQLEIIRGPPMDPPYPVIWPSYGMIGLSFLRIVIGLCFIAVIRASIKTFARFTIQRFILTKDELSKISTTKKQVVTELTYKFLTYTILGFCVVYVIPTIFRFIGIQRPTFHTEMQVEQRYQPSPGALITLRL